ncbi:PREDICTED: uncharacterized protein LOC106124317 isoform X2 [Papilio xuthus]|uniref:Uncharacterized protein LOC106124317 isoform X2 n=1 Tax=Papilio xuthus TaxID=66420 RepID=A0AAJ6ZNJ7_PAPXU|nr:PREDICTED: uncharacterized protein LOC106124317 isoform X2 [Papilio xuthus]
MPDTLSLSTGVSLGLLAGIVSGVCYLMANGINWPRDEEIYRKHKQRSITSSAKPSVCVQCGGHTEGGVVPCVCHNHKPVKFESGAWFLRQAQRALSMMPWSLSTDKLEQIEEECEPSSSMGDVSSELHSIREFLELLSARLAGGALEGTRVAPLYDHPEYLPQSQHGSSAGYVGSGASGAHAQLKRLVARVVEEAAALPALARYAAAPSPTPTPTPTIHSSTYEDLLATAILNKVIERYQTESGSGGSGGRSSGIHSASASPSPSERSERSDPRSLHSRNTRDISPPLREEEDVSDWEEGDATDEAEALPRRVPFPEFGGDIVHNDNEDHDFDEISSSDIQAVDGSWEENWLFQKKKIKTIQSVPVPMLVPNSNADYRALIGDRDAEDTTDLSDNASDAEEQAADYKSDVKKVLDSKHIIGGKAKVPEIHTDDFEADSLDNMIFIGSDDNEKYNDTTIDENISTDFDNEGNINLVNNNEENDSILLLDVESGPPPKAEFNLNEEIHRSIFNDTQTGLLIDLDTSQAMEADSLENLDHGPNSKIFTDSTATNTLSRHERVGEYEETVAVPVQRYADSLRRQHAEDDTKRCTTIDDNDDLIPGSIAHRERQKWLNYVEMPNNPYSPEAIQKRLTTKSTSSLFDSLTCKDKEFKAEVTEVNQVNPVIEKEVDDEERKHNGTIDEEVTNKIHSITLNENEIDSLNGKIRSPTHKSLKRVLSEEIPQYKRYGRDYYIKDAKMSSGARKTNSLCNSDTSSISSIHKSTSLDNFDTEFASPGLLIQQFTTIATNQHYTKFAGKDEMQISVTTMPNNNDQILIEYEDANEHTLFVAKPAMADDTDSKFDEILQSAYNPDTAPLTIEIINQDDISEKSPENLIIENSFISTSSLEDSIKIYNVQTGEIVKCKPDDKVSPRYEETVDNNDNIEILDKNLSEEMNDSLSTNVDTCEETNTTITNIEREESLNKISDIEDILSQLPNVKELAKKFVSMENLNESTKPPQQPVRRRKSKDNMLNFEDKTDKPPNKLIYMHSLTARSISKEFRDELKLSLATPLTVPGGSKAIPEGLEEISKESSRPGSPVPEPGTIKTKLAFFESLKSKLSK